MSYAVYPDPAPAIPDRATRIQQAEAILNIARARRDLFPTEDNEQAVVRWEIYYNDLVQGDTENE